MATIHNDIIFRRLDDLFEQSADLAKAANAEVLTYLIEIAKLALESLRVGGDQREDGPFVRITQQRR